MFSKQQIIDTLNSEDLFIDNFLLEAFIKNWKIEPIYEDAQGIEFFDDMAIEKIRNGIKQKQPKCEINIIDKDEITPVDMAVEISENPPAEETPSEEPEQHQAFEDTKETEQPEHQNEETHDCAEESVDEEICTEHKITEVQELPVALLNEVNKEVENAVQNEMKQVTLDISNQTLAVLAESIARKITSDVAEFIKETDFIEGAVQLGECKKDNQILVEKIEELISDNKILVKRIQELEKEAGSFSKLFGAVYIKNP